MPVTRRAPYVAIATWPGDHENHRFNPSQPRYVSFVDMRTDHDDDAYATLWEQSEEHARAILSEPPAEARRYRRVAFCLSRSVVETIQPPRH